LPEPAPDYRWKKGQSGNPAGRPEGSRNKFAGALFDDVYETWQTHGRAALIVTAEQYPNEFVRVCASLMPRETHATVLNVHVERISDRQLIEAITRADLIRQEIGDRDEAAAEDAPVLEHVGEGK